MRASDYKQLIASLMLMPFTDPELIRNDYLCKLTRAYKRVIDDSWFRDEPSHKKAKESFEQTKQWILRHLGNDPRWMHLDDIQMLLDSFFPAYKIINYYDESTNDIGRFYIRHIFDVARTFITFRDGVVSARSWSDLQWLNNEEGLLSSYDGLQKIELWNNISRTVPMDIFIAAAYINFGVDDAGMLVDVPNLVSLADIPLNRILKNGVAETHMHLNVGFSYSFLWRNFVGLSENPNKSAGLWFCTFFRIFSATYIEKCSNRSYSSFSSFLSDDENDIIKSVKLVFYQKYIQGNYDENDKNSTLNSLAVSDFKKTLYELYGEEELKSDDILFDTLYHNYSKNGTSSEIIWYFKILSFLNRNYDVELCREFLMYLRLKNNFFNNKIQSNKIGGLDFFRDFYHNASSALYSQRLDPAKAQHDAYYSIFEEQCRTGNLDVLEVKITPPITSSGRKITDVDEIKRRCLSQIQKIAEAYKDYILDTKERSSNSDNLRFPKLGLIYHFIKQNDCDNFSGYNCVMSEDAKGLDCMDYSTMRTLNIKFCKALKQLIQDCPLVSKYVVGIDAASVENSSEPWVFAPIFREFRKNNYIFPVSPETRERISNLGFTYHVGEDFRHIASGLRHIDEVLSHFNYCSGDRLGHAIALGVDIDRLMEQNRVVVLPVMEHLENLLWMWSKSMKSTSLKAPQNLEYMIMSVAQSIYGNVDGISVFMLWQVYNEKFNVVESDKAEKVKHEGHCLLNKSHCGDVIWTKDILLCSHFCPCYFELYNRPVFVKISDEEISLYKALQNSLRSKIEEIGIYIETNPSSNTAIGDIDGIYNHPIINLNNSGLEIGKDSNNCVMTTINSDDPLVFSTCVENEIAYIYYSLLHAGCKRENVLGWIDKIRNHGLNSSFVKYGGTYNDMLNDFNDILNYTVK